MAQEEILNVLEIENRPLCRGEIARLAGMNDTHVSRVLKALLKHNEVKCFELSREEAIELSADINLNRRTRFYFVTRIKA